MRFVASIFFIIGSLAVTQVFAEDAIPQPLTHADCDKAGLRWNDNTHACGVTFDEGESAPQSELTAASEGQPLTREACELASMYWNDSVNVCEENAEEAGTQADARTSAPSTILINIDKAAQRMMVSIDGEERYHWKVSTGRAGYSTPSGTFTAKSMNEMWYSREWDDAPMPHSIFFTKDGHAIHGTEEVKGLGKPASHGCVRLSPENAATLYTLVADNGLENTQVVLAGLAPGRTTHKSRYSRVAPSDEHSVQPEKRTIEKRHGGIFRRLFGRR